MKNFRFFFFLICLVGAFLAANSSVSARGLSTSKRVLIYRGPGTCDGCAEVIGNLVLKIAYTTVEYVTPEQITPQNLSTAVMYVQPGGDDDDTITMKALGAERRDLIREFVAHGGIYFGVCAGAFLAGDRDDSDISIAAFGFLTSTLRPEIADPKASIVDVRWSDHVGERTVPMYYQMGPAIDLGGLANPQIWGFFERSGHVAAVIGEWQLGTVALWGPHPEATFDWYDEDHLPRPEHLNHDLGIEFLAAVLARAQNVVLGL